MIRLNVIRFRNSHKKPLKQVKCEVIEKNFTGCEQQKMSNSFSFKVLHIAWPELLRKRSIIVEKLPPTVPYKTQEKLAYHQLFVSACFVSTFDLGFEPAAICFYLRYSVSLTQNKLCDKL